MPGDETASHELADAGPALAREADAEAPARGPVVPDADAQAPARGRTARLEVRRLRGTPARWLSIFGGSLGLFLIRLLVPVPVGQADNRDGPRLMCGQPLGLGPVYPRGYPRYFRYAYFQYAPSASCHGRLPYPSSELVPLELARFLTPVFGLPGTLNLLALGVLMCALTSVAIASLVTGLRIRLWAQLLLAASIWLIMADAAFFDVFASPFSEPAVMVGLLLVAAGLVYLGRSPRANVLGLVLAGSGGFLAALSKEQYLLMAVPICLAIVAASVPRGDEPWLRRLRTRQTGAAAAVAAVIAVLAGAYGLWDATSSYGQRLHHIQSVDMIFQEIVTGHDNTRADLRALGLPASWARYAGTYYWDKVSVRNDPLYRRYEPELTGSNIVHFLLTHPGRIVSVGQQAAVQAQLLRVTALGDYPPHAGYRRGAYESRVVVVTKLVHQFPKNLGLAGLVPLWASMLATAIVALRRRQRGRPWHRDGGVVVLCLTGCAMLSFLPPAYFAGISTTRHMFGMNVATLLAVPLAIALAASMIFQVLPRARQRQELPRPSPDQRPGLSPVIPDSTENS